MNSEFLSNAADSEFGAGGGIFAGGPIYITNCTFVNNHSAIVGGLWLEGTRYESHVDNSIFYYDTGRAIFDTTSALIVRNSDVADGYTADTSCAAGNFDADPVFVDPDGIDDELGTLDDNYRLGCSSPCIDYGDVDKVPLDSFNVDEESPPDTSELTADRDLSIRVNRAAPDLGASESHGSPDCPADISPIGTGNCVVNVDDLLVVLNGWGYHSGPGDIQIDCGGDGQVNTDDLLLVINSWGPCGCESGNMAAPAGGEDDSGGDLPTWLADCLELCGGDEACVAQCVIDAYNNGDIH